MAAPPWGRAYVTERSTASASTAQLASWIDRTVWHDTAGLVAGLQDDVDASYSMRRVLEEAIAEHAQRLETDYHHGRRWPDADKLDRTGVNPRTRDAGDTELLQSWIQTSVRRRCYGVVNGTKSVLDGYTVRMFLEDALRVYKVRMERQHNRVWEPVEHLRRGRR